LPQVAKQRSSKRQQNVGIDVGPAFGDDRSACMFGYIDASTNEACQVAWGRSMFDRVGWREIGEPIELDVDRWKSGLTSGRIERCG
jgi:hypothetical protein